MKTRIKTSGLYYMDIAPLLASAIKDQELIFINLGCTGIVDSMGIAISPKEARRTSRALAFYADKLEGKK